MLRKYTANDDGDLLRKSITLSTYILITVDHASMDLVSHRSAKLGEF